MGYIPPRGASVDYLKGKLRSYEPLYVHDLAWLELEFSLDSSDELPSLTIATAKYESPLKK